VLRSAGYIWIGTRFGDTPFLLSLICSSCCRRAKAVYMTEHCFCFNASFPERECTLSSSCAASLEFTQSSSQSVYAFVFLTCFCVFANWEVSKGINCKRSLAFSFNAQIFPRSFFLNRKVGNCTIGKMQNWRCEEVSSCFCVVFFEKGYIGGCGMAASTFMRHRRGCC